MIQIQNHGEYGWYGKDGDTNYINDWEQLDLIGAREVTGSDYYLASRAEPERVYGANFFIRIGCSDGTLSGCLVVHVNEDGGLDESRSGGVNWSLGLRPVFSLKSTVKIKEGSGDGKTLETAYELEVQ